MDMESVLRQVRADLAAAEVKLTDQQSKVDKLRAAVTGLEYALSTYGDTAEKDSRRTEVAPAPTPPADSSWLVLNKEKQSLRALTEIGGTAGTRAITDKMISVGLDVDARAVKGYMNSLKRKGLVYSVQVGTWGLIEMMGKPPADDEPPNDFGPTVETVGPKVASDGDVPSRGTVIAGAFGASQPAR
jgi:hypothetical protein